MTKKYSKRKKIEFVILVFGLYVLFFVLFGTSFTSMIIPAILILLFIPYIGKKIIDWSIRPERNLDLETKAEQTSSIVRHSHNKGKNRFRIGQNQQAMKALFIVSFIVFLIIVTLLFGTDYERRNWNKAQKTNVIGAYKSYLTKYPQGKYVTEAVTIILNKAKELEQRGHYQAARVEYTYIIEKYPNSKEAMESQERLLVVYQAIGWEKAKLDNTIEAYQAFIKNYPNNVNVSFAKSAIAKLKKAALVEAKKKSKTTSVPNNSSDIWLASWTLSVFENGYAWNKASSESRIALCKELAINLNRLGSLDSDYYYRALNDFYNTSNNSVLQTTISQAASLILVGSRLGF
jgi:outer membrane protein assembly factor BamD (BamD/ComL family)